jgi:ATP-dependent DNA helicase RecQ
MCSASDDGERETVTGDDLLTVRKALAGVARASRRGAGGEWVAIYGRGKIMDMLRGAQNAAMNQHLMGMSTYGILKSLSSAKIKALFRSMHEAGLLQTTGGDMPLITLSRQGEDVMQSRSVPQMSLRGWSGVTTMFKNKVARQDKTRQLLEGMGIGRLDKELYEHLATLRRDLAAEFNLPAYRIMHNETLKAFATLKPTTVEAASRIKGIGSRMRESRYLRAFLELIQDYEER